MALQIARRQLHQFLVLLFALVVIELVTASSVWAQGGLFGVQPRRDEDLFLNAPRSLQRLLNEGKQAIEEKRYSEGIAALGALLTGSSENEEDELLGQDFFLTSQRAGYYTQSIKGEAIRLLSELPEEGRKSLEIAFGVKARQELDAGIANHNMDAISDVVRKYMHTDAGYDAMALVAQYKLAAGYPLAAGSLLQKLLEFPAARQRFGIKLAAAAAIAYRQADRVDLAINTLKQAATQFPGVEINVAGRAVPLKVGSDWAQIVGNLTDRSVITDNTMLESWTVSGGSPERNATNQAGMPLRNARWFERVHGSVKEEEALSMVSVAARQQNNVILPKLEARFVNDLVLFKTTNSAVFARDFETGLLKWPYFLHGTPLQLTNGPQLSDSTDAGASVSEELKNRVWGSSAFGNFSCDAERLYFVSSDAEQPINARTFAGTAIRSFAADSNFLEGVSLSAEGAMLWRLGGPTSEADPALANAFFLGPPLPFENQLFTLVEINGETHLVVLEPETGKLIWQQQLVSSQMSEISQDPQRRSLALSPTISDGVIVCPTGNGAIVALDLVTRRLRWARTYESNRDNRSNQFNTRMLDLASNYEPLGQRWHEPFAIADQGRVLVTPPESDLLLCYDILTGENKWKGDGIKRGTGRYIVGANQDFVVLAGNSQLFAYRYDGSPAWICPLPKGQTLAGKGVWQGDSMLIPLSRQQVIKVSAADGQILETASVDIPLGNLFAHKKQLVSISPTYIAAFYTRESLEGDVKERLAKNPNDAWALNRQSQLEMAEDKLQTAVELLERSYKIDPQNADTRFLLVEALLRGLEEDFVKFQAASERYAQVFDFPQQRFRYLQSLALGNVKNEQHFAAAKNLLELVRNRMTDSIASQPHRRELLNVGNGHKVDSETWISVQLARTYAQASPQEREKIDAAIRQELDHSKHALAPNRRQLLRYFAWLPNAAPEVLRFAQMIIDSETTLAERTLQPLLMGSDAEASKQALTLLTRNPKWDWFSLGAYGEYVQRLAMSTERLDQSTYDRIRRMFPAFHAESITIDQLQNAKVTWPSGLVVKSDVVPTFSGPYGSIVGTRAPMPSVQNRYGRPPLTVRLSQGSLTIHNQLGQQVATIDYERATSDGSDGFARCQVNGGLILVETASEILAVDLYNDYSRNESLLWRHSLVAASPTRETILSNTTSELSPLGFVTPKRASATRQAIVGPLTPAGVAVQTGTTLSMLDALSGATLWTLENLSDQTRFAAQGLELAVVEPSRGTTLILDCRDGTELRRVDYKGDWQHWFCSGPMMVDYGVRQSNKSGSGVITPSDSPTTLRIWNVFTGEDVKRLDLRERTRANTDDNRFIVALEPTGARTGTLHVIDLETQKFVQHEVPKDADVDSIGVMKFEDRLVVFSHSSRIASGSRAPQRINQDFLLANGLVYGINCKDGSLLWERPAALYNYFVPQSQPRSSPFVAAYRPQAGAAREPLKVALMAFDSRDGSIAFSEDSLVVPTSTVLFDMSLQPLDGTISISLGEISIAFQPTEEPKPPQPVFRMGAVRAIPARNGFDFFGN